MPETRDILLLIGAYLLGAVPFGYLVGRSKGIDIRTVGSGNIGATNVGRVLGRRWGILVFALDVLKGMIPAAVAAIMSGGRLGEPQLNPIVAMCGMAAIIGHNWPVYLKFHGGKGVATSCGAFFVIFPAGLLIALGVWVAMLGITRYVSVSSMVAALALLASAVSLTPDPFGRGKVVTIVSGIAAALSIWRHRGNIRRLRAGTEPKVGQRKA